MTNCDADRYGYTNCYGAWWVWGRWVVVGAVVLAVLAVYLIFACLTARKRRRAGINPYFGTGWTLGKTPPGHAPLEYNPQQPPDQNAQRGTDPVNEPPPAYVAGREHDLELGQPKPTATQ